MWEAITGPWPWYTTGPLLGLMVPFLMLAGNKHFGVSSSLRHVCAAVFKPKAEYFRYDWKKSGWNLALVAGTIVGGVLAVLAFGADTSPQLSEGAHALFASWGMEEATALQPAEVFAVGADNWLRPLVFLALGGFLVGFGARYAGGCTSGHAIMGTALLNPGSYVAAIAFLVGGFAVSNLIIPALIAL